LSRLGRFRRYNRTSDGRGEWLTAVVVAVAARFAAEMSPGSALWRGVRRGVPRYGSVGSWPSGGHRRRFFCCWPGRSRSVHHIRLDRAAPRVAYFPPGAARSTLPTTQGPHSSGLFFHRQRRAPWPSGQGVIRLAAPAIAASRPCRHLSTGTGDRMCRKSPGSRSVPSELAPASARIPVR